MRRYTYIIIFYLFTITNSFSQRKADKTITFDNTVNEFFFHEISGVPMVETAKGISGIDGSTGEIIWTVASSKTANVLNTLGQDVAIYETVAFTPFGIVNNKMFDSRNGALLLNPSKNGYTNIISNKVLLETGEVIVSTRNKETKKQTLHFIDIASNSTLWSKELDLNSKKAIKNIKVEGDIVVMSIDKNLIILNKSNGEILLNKKEDIGQIIIDKLNNSVLIVEDKGGSVVGSVIKASFTMGLSLLGDKPLGKKITAYSLQNGEEVWEKPIKLGEGYLWSSNLDNKLLVKHEDGVNIFDYKTGESFWKKDFSKKSVKSVEKTSEGYIVYYGSKKILLNSEGKKVWKKPKSAREGVSYDVNDDEELYSEFKYESGFVIVKPTRIDYYKPNTKKPEWKISINDDTKITYDRDRNNILVLDGKKFYILNPDNNQGKDQVQKIDLKKAKDFTTLEIRKDKYFMSSPWEYLLVDFKGKIINKNYYKQPGEGLRLLKNVGAVALDVYGAGSQVSGIMNTGVGASAGTASFLSGSQTSKGYFNQA